MSTIQRRAWMQTLCGDWDNGALRTPFASVIDGERCDVATNGHAMLAVFGDPAYPEKPEAPGHDALKKVTAAAHEQRWSGPIDELRDWAYPDEPCRNCGGSGVESTELPCGCEETHACSSCKATGRGRSLALLCGRAVARWLLFRYLIPLNGGEISVAVAGPRESICISGDGWRLWVMPCIASVSDGVELPRFPEGS